MPLLDKERTVILSSDPARGAGNVSPDGSRFEVRILPDLDIPKEAVSVTVSMETADVWYTTPNIKAGVNDRLYLSGPDVANIVTAYALTIPAGLYSITALNDAIQLQLATLGAKVSPLPIFSLSADVPTQRVVATFNYTTVSVDMSPADSLAPLLGFAAATYGPYGVAPTLVSGPNAPLLNAYNYYLIHSDIIRTGISVNGTESQVLGRIPINVPISEQVIYAPNHPPTVDAHNLAGAHRSRIAVWITDEHGNALDTFGDSYTLSLRVKWKVAA